MKYRRLGNSGLKISEIGLGSWLTYGTAAEQKAADACISKAFECGINFFDTANAYNRGEGEKAMGAALRSYERSSYVLSTKVFSPWETMLITVVCPGSILWSNVKPASAA